MRGVYLFLLILTGTPVWIMALQALLTRLGLRRVSGQVSAIASCALAALPVGYLIWAVHLHSLEGGRLMASVAYATLLFALLAYSYFHIFNMSETARRIKMLIELRERGQMTTEKLKSFYNIKVMLDRRIDRLICLGQVRFEGDRVVLSSKSLFLVARVMSWWCGVLALPSFKGFYLKK